MKKIAALVGTLCLLLAFAGCSERAGMAASKSFPADKSARSAPASPSGGEAADALAEKSAVATSQAPTGTVSMPQARMVIKTASLSVRVKDVPAAYGRAIQLAEGSGGFVQTSAQSQEDGERADLTIMVPPHGFLPLISALEGLGSQESKSISGEDVTEEYYDLSSELDNQMEVRARLFQLLRQAKKVEEAIAVEQQLERIGGNVNKIKGRMKYLETMTGMSTINLSLYTDARAAAEPFINWSLIGHGFFRAAQILVQGLFIILQALLVIIPLAAIAGAAAWGVILLVRFARARRAVPAKRKR